MRASSRTVRKRGKATRGRFLRLVVGVIVLASVSGTVALRSLPRKAQEKPVAVQKSIVKQPHNFAELIALQPAELSDTDIALMNLLCAEGLPGAENLDINKSLATLDQWTEWIDSETKRNYHRFQEDPGYYYNSKAFYKMLMMAVVIYEDFGVRYNPKWIISPSDARPDDHFFADSKDVLINGMLGPTRMGTCSSMPVLYVALGRRLGYPLKLVRTREHLFMRWESPTEKFDMDATSKGLDKYDDTHYKSWPFPLTQEEIRNEGYLKSLTTAEELSVFLNIRAACLTECGRLAEATLTFRSACLRAPDWRGNRVLLAEAEQRQRAANLSSFLPPDNGTGQGLPPDPNPLRDLQNANQPTSAGNL